MVSAGAAARSTCEHDRPRHTCGLSTVARVRAVRVRPAFVDAIAFAYGMPCVLFCNRRTRCMVRVGTEVVQCVCLLRQELSASTVSRWSIRLAWPAAQAVAPDCCGLLSLDSQRGALCNHAACLRIPLVLYVSFHATCSHYSGCAPCAPCRCMLNSACVLCTFTYPCTLAVSPLLLACAL